MRRPWFAMTTDFRRDPKLRRAGFEARMIWSTVLAALHPGGGWCDADDLSADVLADLEGGEEEWWARGLDGLRRLGLLVEAPRRQRGGAGGFTDRPGWTTPNWSRYQQRPGDRSLDADRSGPIVSDRGAIHERSGGDRGAIDPDSGQQVQVQGQGEQQEDVAPQAGPPGVCDPGPSRSEMTIAMERVWEAYRRHHPQAGAGTRAGDGGPAGAARKLLRRACGDHDADALVVLMDYVHASGEGGPRFLRGENPDSRKYLGLDNLLRAEKLPARVEAALAWEARGRQDEAAPSNGGGAAGNKTARLRAMAARVAAEQRRARPAEEG